MNEVDIIHGLKDNIVLRTLLSNTPSQELFAARLYGLVNGSMQEDRVIQELDRLNALLEPDIEADPFAILPFAEHAAQVELIRNNIREHWISLRNQRGTGEE